jgi:hypothetical protein
MLNCIDSKDGGLKPPHKIYTQKEMRSRYKKRKWVSSKATPKSLSIFVAKREQRVVYLSMDEPLRVGRPISTMSPHLQSDQRIACQSEDRSCSKRALKRLHFVDNVNKCVDLPPFFGVGVYLPYLKYIIISDTKRILLTL